MKGNGIHYPFFKGELIVKKKEIEKVFKKTPKKGFYTLEKEGYLFVLESLGFFKYGLLSVIEEKGPINEFIDRLVIHNQYVERSYIMNNEFGIVLNRINIEALESLLDEIIVFFKENNIHNVCLHCHQRKDLSFFYNDVNIEISCEDCLQDVEYKEHPSHPVKGLLGVIIECLIPTVIFIYSRYIGYLIAPIGIIYALLGYYGYKKLGGYMDKKGICISFITPLLMMFIGQGVRYVYDVMDAFKANWKINVSFSEALGVTPGLISGSVLAVGLVYLIYIFVFFLVTYVILIVIEKRKGYHFNVIEKL